MKAGIVEPEEKAVIIPYKHICDMTPERRLLRDRNDC
jgi:hypothetical protein